MQELTECPKCLGTGEIIIPENSKTLGKVSCNLCEGTGKIHPEIADDFILSLYDDVD
jgi:hypothetical protein